MATSDELQAKLDEYRAAEAETLAKKEQSDADAAAASEAAAQAAASKAEWRAALVRQHALDDEFDALSAAHEPPELPAE